MTAIKRGIYRAVKRPMNVGASTATNTYTQNYVTFDGTNDYLTAAALTGQANLTQVTLAAWVNLNAAAVNGTAYHILWSNNGPALQWNRSTDNTARIRASGNATASSVFTVDSSSAWDGSTGLICLLFSAKLDQPSGIRLYRGDTDWKGTATEWTTRNITAIADDGGGICQLTFDGPVISSVAGRVVVPGQGDWSGTSIVGTHAGGYIDGNNVTINIPYDGTYTTGGTMYFALASANITSWGMCGTGAQPKMFGQVGYVCVYNDYYDFSQQSNRRLFIDGSGNPVNPPTSNLLIGFGINPNDTAAAWNAGTRTGSWTGTFTMTGSVT